MKYNFDKLTNRRDTHSMKWDVLEHELPMWVADMDFEVANEIKEAIQKRLDHSIFGYNDVPKEFFETIHDWWNNYHDFDIKEEWMMFCTGVVPAISSVVRKITSIKDNVLIMSPVYNIFYNSILNNDRQVLSSDLIYDGEQYCIDFKDLEEKLSLPETTLLILCNPHNPIGKIWDRETLIRIGELCDQHHVYVLSDEIHCDIVKPGYHYTPFMSASQKCLKKGIMCIAPTKAFNIAGLQCACIVVADEALRQRVCRGINTDEVAEPNSFACIASMAAFQKGRKWLEEMNHYVQNNKDMMTQYIQEYIPQLKVVSSESTYLVWIDCSSISSYSEELVCKIREETGLIVTSGHEYGDNGKTFIRINVACPIERLKDGLLRLKTAMN